MRTHAARSLLALAILSSSACRATDREASGDASLQAASALTVFYCEPAGHSSEVERVLRLPPSVWQPADGQLRRSSIHCQILWLKMPVAPVEAADRQLSWRALDYWPDHIDFYLFDEMGQALYASLPAGDAAAPSPAGRWHPAAALEWEQPAGQGRLALVRVENPVWLSSAFALESAREFRRQIGRYWILAGLQIGILLMLIVVYGSLFLALRYSMIRSYLLYLTAYFVYFNLQSGWPALAAPQLRDVLANHLTALAICATYATALGFVRRFLELDKLNPRASLTFRVAQWSIVAPALLTVFYRPLSIQWINVLALAIGPLTLIYALSNWRKNENVRWFVLAWSPPLLAAMTENLRSNGVLPASAFATNALLQPALLLEFCIFSLVIGSRLRNIVSSRARTAERLVIMEKELSLARRIHGQLLAPSVHQLPQARVQIHYQSQRELGGDYYDILQPEAGYLGVFVADVTGHGLPAALDASSVRLAFRMNAPGKTSPAQTLLAINRDLCPMIDYRFISAIYAIVRLSDGLTRIASAGHPPALHFQRKEAQLSRIDASTTMIGIEDDPAYYDQELQLTPGDTLTLYSDGIFGSLEGMSVDQAEERVHTLVRQLAADLDLMQSQALSVALEQLHQRPAVDDITIAAILYRGTAAGDAGSGAAA